VGGAERSGHPHLPGALDASAGRLTPGAIGEVRRATGAFVLEYDRRMSSSTEVAARTYVAAWQEPDRARRAELLEACFAADGRIVTGGSQLRGRAAVATAMDDFFADPRGLSTRLTSGIDATRTTFRFRAILENRDGAPFLEIHDAGEIDADGRISLLLTFVGPLPDLI